MCNRFSLIWCQELYHHHPPTTGNSTLNILNISAVTGPILTNFFGPNFLGLKIFVDQNVLGQNFFGPKFFFSKNFFSGPKILLGLKVLRPKILLIPKKIQTQIFFFNPNLFSPKIFLDSKFFWTQNFFGPKNF